MFKEHQLKTLKIILAAAVLGMSTGCATGPASGPPVHEKPNPNSVCRWERGNCQSYNPRDRLDMIRLQQELGL